MEKQDRKAERLAIMKDIQEGKPVLAINLRVAAEWGIITGYTDNGNRFLCRTYFDKEIFDALEQAEKSKQVENSGQEESQRQADQRVIFEENGESDFQLENDRENVLRRLSVNHNMLCSLIDARNAAAAWLQESSSLLTEDGREHLAKIAENCQKIADMVSAFRGRTYQSSVCAIEYNTIRAYGVSTPELRKEQVGLLENALVLEEENCRQAELILKLPEQQALERISS